MTRAFSLLMSLTRRHSARSSSSFVSRNCCHRRGFASVIAPEEDNNVVNRKVASSSSSSNHNNNVGAGFHGNNDNGRGQQQRFRNPRKVVQQWAEGEEASSSSSAPPPHVFWSSDFCDHRGMQVVFLGTSSSMPTISRNTSCIALRLGMYPWAFVSMNFRILGLAVFFFFFFSVLGSFFVLFFGSNKSHGDERHDTSLAFSHAFLCRWHHIHVWLRGRSATTITPNSLSPEEHW